MSEMVSLLLQLSRAESVYRANQQAVQERSGSGLELPLVKAIAELYDGKIRAYSDDREEDGTFAVEMPLTEESSI